MLLSQNQFSPAIVCDSCPLQNCSKYKYRIKYRVSHFFASVVFGYGTDNCMFITTGMP